jgi:hypothetical protein
MRGVFERRINVLSLKTRIVPENLFERRPGAQKLQDVGDAHSQSANAGVPPALSFVNRYSLEAL